MSAASTWAAPACAQAIAAKPQPEAKSSTRRPRTRLGSSNTNRANAWLPGHANAQNGGAVSCAVSQASVACQIGVISVAKNRPISGTSGMRDHAVFARMNAARSVMK